MRLRLITVRHRVPDWVAAGFAEYAARLPREFAFELVEVPAAARHKSTGVERLKEEEGQALLRAAGERAYRIALDEHGHAGDTRAWARALERWRHDQEDVCLLVGGADGLSQACRDSARECWSLSRLTFPHALVRVLVAEQLYRAWSLSTNHPYHRA